MISGHRDAALAANFLEEEENKEELSENLDRAQVLAEILKALSHPIRLRIIAVLCVGHEHVSGLAARLELPQAIVSQQLRILRMKGLVLKECQSGFAYYRLGEPKLRDLVHCMEGCRKGGVR